MSWQASQQFEAGYFLAAERAYRDILNDFSEDLLAKFKSRNAQTNNDPVLRTCLRCEEEQRKRPTEIEPPLSET